MAQGLGPLPLTQETWVAFRAPGLGLCQAQPLPAFEE